MGTPRNANQSSRAGLFYVPYVLGAVVLSDTFEPVPNKPAEQSSNRLSIAFGYTKIALQYWFPGAIWPISIDTP